MSPGEIFANLGSSVSAACFMFLRVVGRFVVRPVGHRRSRSSSCAVSSSSDHCCPLLACPPLSAPRLGLRGVGGGAAVFSLCLCGRRAVCRIVLGGSCCGVLVSRVFSSCLLALRWCRIAILPVLFDKTGGAMLLRRSCGVGRSHRPLVGVGSCLALFSPFIRVGRAVSAMRR